MKLSQILALASASAALWHSQVRAQFADSVLNYQPGTGYAAEFGTGLGYTNATAILGEPARSTINPFAPPFTRDHLLSLGTNGAVTVKLDTPILDDPANPFGLDFLVFGNAGFIITNGNFSGGGITSGAPFGGNPGTTRVSVSADGVTFYTLDPQRAPTVDNLFPTDGAGIFTQPVNPALTPASFAGLGLRGITELYAGSGGGTGFDLAWAQDAQGQPARLALAEYVRVQVVSGKSEIDGIGVVLPNTSASGVAENFLSDPRARGWTNFGDASLFAWDTNKHSLRTTWDSSRRNAYFYRELGTTITAGDDFTLGFDLTLEDIAAGVATNKASTFQIAVGLLNLAEARRTNFFRGSGVNGATGARSVVEWNYFPDTGFGATVSPGAFSTNNEAQFGFTFPLELTTNTHYRVTIAYTATNRVLRTSMLSNGIPMQAIANAILPATNSFDFRLDAVAIASYSDAGQSGQGFDGSILAHGWVDNVRVSIPPFLKLQFVRSQAGVSQVRFFARKNWRYTLERSADLQRWTALATQTATDSSQILMEDGQPGSAQSYYRIRAELP